MTAPAALLVCLVVAGGARPQTDPPRWSHQASGAFRSLFTVSRSYVTGERSADGLNRLRAAIGGGRGEAISYRVEIDSQTHVGTRVSTPDFELVRGRQDEAWADLQVVLVDEPHVYSDVSVYRATVSLRSSSATVTLGRQRIAWGTARFWSPADLFNPIDPLQVEGDVRQGVDAVQVEWASAGSARGAMVYAPGTGGRSLAAARLGATVGVWDLAGFGGRFRGDWVGGAEVAGQWGGAGLHGEVTYHWRGSSGRPDALRVAGGWDYAWPTLYVVAEYFYNQGQPSSERAAASESLAQLTSATELITRHRHFLSGGATFDVTPLLAIDTFVVFDVAGSSALVNPIVRYNLSASVDVSAGAQLFDSASGGEFDRVPELFFVKVDVHF